MSQSQLDKNSASISFAKEIPSVPLWRDPFYRGVATQLLLFAVVCYLIYSAAENAVVNMNKHNIPTDFRFWNAVAGFDINFSLIPYSALSTYGAAFYVGLYNTLLVSAIGIVLATIVGFVIGIMRLSKNWIVAKVGTIYVETIRNIPLVLQLLFWYNAVVKPLPEPKNSYSILASVFLNNRGVLIPSVITAPGFSVVLASFFIGLAGAITFALYARHTLLKTGQQLPAFSLGLLMIIGLPLIAFVVMGAPVTFDFPKLGRFNLSGGLSLSPEFFCLILGLVTYTGAFIAEIVRSSILSVSKGQIEAAHALGLRGGITLKLVVVPQAMRVMIPPLTSQYLNLTKNSSLATFIGFPDFVSVFTGTVLNQTGAAVQVMVVTMAVYLSISLVTSFAMNIYNKKMALIER